MKRGNQSRNTVSRKPSLKPSDYNYQLKLILVGNSGMNCDSFTPLHLLTLSSSIADECLKVLERHHCFSVWKTRKMHWRPHLQLVSTVDLLCWVIDCMVLINSYSLSLSHLDSKFVKNWQFNCVPDVMVICLLAVRIRLLLFYWQMEYITELHRR